MSLIHQEMVGKYTEMLEAFWDGTGTLLDLGGQWLTKDELKKKDPGAFAAMAKQLYETGSIRFRLKDDLTGKPVYSDSFTVDQLQDKVRLKGQAAGFGDKAKEFDLKQQFVPKAEVDKIEKLAEDVRARHSSFSWDDIGTYFTAFVMWIGRAIGSLFGGAEYKGFFETVAELKAPQVQQEMQEGLTKIAREDKTGKIASLLGRDSGYQTPDGRKLSLMEYIPLRARDEALKVGGAKPRGDLQLGVAPVLKNPAELMGALTQGAREAGVRGKSLLIADAVLSTQTESELNARLKKPFGMDFDLSGSSIVRSIANKFGGRWATQDQIFTMRGAISERLTRVWEDPKRAADLNKIYDIKDEVSRKEAMKVFVAKEVTEALKGEDGKGGLRAKDDRNLKSGEIPSTVLTDTVISSIADSVGAGVAEKITDFPRPALPAPKTLPTVGSDTKKLSDLILAEMREKEKEEKEKTRKPGEPTYHPPLTQTEMQRFADVAAGVLAANKTLVEKRNYKGIADALIKAAIADEGLNAAFVRQLKAKKAALTNAEDPFGIKRGVIDSALKAPKGPSMVLAVSTELKPVIEEMVKKNERELSSLLVAGPAAASQPDRPLEISMTDLGEFVPTLQNIASKMPVFNLFVAAPAPKR